MLSAVVLGGALTSLSWRHYYESAGFWAYWLNIAGDIHFQLPGVFTKMLDVSPAGDVSRFRPDDTVNGSLWTIPFEFECYALITILYLIYAFKKPRWFVIFFAMVTVVGTVRQYIINDPGDWDGNVPGRALVAAFLVGVILQIFAEKIYLNRKIFVASVVCTYVLLLDPRLCFFAVFPAAYVTVYLGMLNPKKAPVLFSGDYSYGLYLFAYPIQATQVYLFPNYRWWVYNAAFTLVLGFAYAAFSWWCVEAPILARKRAISATVNRFFERRASSAARPTRA